MASFTIDNKDDGDVFVSMITMRDDENNIDDYLANFVLKAGGQVLATTAAANGRYVTFNFSTPFEIQDGDTEDFNVYADVIGGAGESVALYVDKGLDVSGIDASYGFGLNVDVSNYQPQKFDITAGDLTFISHPIPTDQTRADKDDVVIAEFKINVDAGQDLILEDIAFDIFADYNPTQGQCLPVPILNVLENIELRDVTNGGTYDLNINTNTNAGGNCHVVAYDDDMGISLPSSGPAIFQLVTDIVNTLPTGVEDDEFYAEIRPGLYAANQNNSNTSYVRIEESADDELVTDITPSFLSFSSIEFVASQLDINRLPVSNKTVVVGGSNIELIAFEIETDDVAPVTVDEFILTGNANFNQNVVSQVSLYRGMYPNGTLVETDSLNGSSTSITFDQFGEILVPASSTQPMYVTIDLVDDSTNVTKVISASVSSVDAEDDDNDTITPFFG